METSAADNAPTAESAGDAAVIRKKSFLQRHGYALFFSLALAALTGFVLLDTFVLPHAVTTVVTTAASEQTAQTTQSQAQTSAGTTATVVNTASSAAQTETQNENASSEVVVTDSAYSGNGISIVITTVRTNNTNAYVADV